MNFDYRGGNIELTTEKPRGLPFLKPLYGLPPYQYTGDVLLIHDGPPGREAWRVDVLRDGRLVRWIFVIPGGIYERAPGGVRGEGGSSS